MLINEDEKYVPLNFRTSSIPKVPEIVKKNKSIAWEKPSTLSSRSLKAQTQIECILKLYLQHKNTR